MRHRLPLFIGVLLLAALVAQLLGSLPAGSQPIATHFDGAGRPNGWMTPQGLLLFEGAVFVFMTTVILGSTFLPASMINIPNRDYWLAGERSDEGRRRLRGHMLWLLCLAVAFFIGLNRLVLTANAAAGGPRLATPQLLAFVAAWLAGLGIWMARLWLLFSARGAPASPGGASRPPGAPARPGPGGSSGQS